MARKKEFNKSIRGLKVKESREVFGHRNGKDYLRNPELIYGRVDKEVPGVICDRTVNGLKYLDDFANLSKTNKKEIIDKFYNLGNSHNRKVLYLVKSEYDKEPVKKSKTKTKNSNNPNNSKTPSATNTKTNKDKCCNDSRFTIQGKKVRMAMNNYYTYKNSKKKDK